MALAFNPFDLERRDRRLTDPQLYSQMPGGGVVNPNVTVPVANPDPQQEVVQSLPNQLNAQTVGAYADFEDFRDGYSEWNDAGLGYLGLPTPQLTATSERDQTNGDYISQGYTSDWAGVPDWLRPLQERFLAPEVGRANASIAATNEQRELVRSVTPTQTYQTQRPVQNINPLTGRSYTTFVNTTKFNPNFPVESLYI